MRKLLAGLVAVVFVLGITGLVQAADLKIGHVDTLKVFNDYQKTKDYDKQLEAKQKGKEEEQDKKIAELKKLQDQYALLSDAEKEKKKGEIEKLAQDLDQFRRTAVTDLRKQQGDFMNEIVKEIEDTVKSLAKAQGYNYVLNGQAVIVGIDANDLTETVLKELNSKYGKK